MSPFFSPNFLIELSHASFAASRRVIVMFYRWCGYEYFLPMGVDVKRFSTVRTLETFLFGLIKDMISFKSIIE